MSLVSDRNVRWSCHMLPPMSDVDYADGGRTPLRQTVKAGSDRGAARDPPGAARRASAKMITHRFQCVFTLRDENQLLMSLSARLHAASCLNAPLHYVSLHAASVIIWTYRLTYLALSSRDVISPRRIEWVSHRAIRSPLQTAASIASFRVHALQVPWYHVRLVVRLWSSFLVKKTCCAWFPLLSLAYPQRLLYKRGDLLYINVKNCSLYIHYTFRRC